MLKTLWEHAAGLPAGGIAGGAMLLCGWAAENLAVPTRLPFETVYRDMQTSTTNEGGIATTRRIIKTEGFLGLYTGFGAHYIRVGCALHASTLVTFWWPCPDSCVAGPDVVPRGPVTIAPPPSALPFVAGRTT